MLGMRRTMFVVPRDHAPLLHSACARAIAVAERKRVLAMLGGAGLPTDPEPWLADVEAATLAALEARGEATATELTAVVPGLGLQIPFGEGKRWQGTFGMSTRVLFLLSMEGRIVRARPRGSWLSSQYRWSPVDRWLGSNYAEQPIGAARTELVRRWLAGFGPGTVADLRWWTGWTLGEVRRALAAVATVEVGLDSGETGLVLEGDVEPTPDPGAWIAFLPTLDTTVMGWTKRDWYLGTHATALFDRSGNGGPTIWADGRVVGGWGQRPNGEVVTRLLEDVGAEAAAAIDAQAARLDAWLGGTRITPRFRTPIELDMGGSS
jgi:hypothetical protein